jgi:DNA-binding NarL/FixJ family response regulator
MESRQDLMVCDEAANGEEAILKADQFKPDLIILDMNMPLLDGLSAAKEIRERLPEIPILLLSMNDSRQMDRISRSAGAQGFICKQNGSKVLLEAVYVLLAGGTFFLNRSKSEQHGKFPSAPFHGK